MKRKNIIALLSILAIGATAVAAKFDVGFKAPSFNGTGSVGAAEQGAIILDSTNLPTTPGVFYGNNGTAASPNWVALGGSTNIVAPTGASEKMARLYVDCSSGTCGTLSNQSGTWVTAISGGSSVSLKGQYTLTITGFSAAPTCTVTTGASGPYVAQVVRISTTSLEVVTALSTNLSSVDTDFNLICMGPQ